MPIPTHTSTCTLNRIIARDVWEFRISKPKNFTYSAGQFVLFKVPLLENASDIQTRALSIGSAPSEEDLLFIAKMKEGGRISRWIVETLKAGMPVEFQGPFGFFTLKSENPKDYLFIATSTGIAPFRGQIIDALEKNDRRRMDLIFGVRSEEDLFWIEELQKLEQSNENLSLHIVLSQPSENWKGHRGRVQAVTKDAISDLSTRQLYICGSPEMTTNVKKLAMEEWGVAKGEVHAEGYI